VPDRKSDRAKPRVRSVSFVTPPLYRPVHPLSPTSVKAFPVHRPTSTLARLPFLMHPPCAIRLADGFHVGACFLLVAWAAQGHPVRFVIGAAKRERGTVIYVNLVPRHGLVTGETAPTLLVQNLALDALRYDTALGQNGTSPPLPPDCPPFLSRGGKRLKRTSPFSSGSG